MKSQDTLDSLSNIDRAATIKSLATKADQVSREGLETYRQIGEHLNAEKLVQGHGKFLPWFEAQVFPFTIRTAQRMMKLSDKWDEIEKIKNDSDVVFDHTITGSLALLKPKPIQPADAERVLKLAEVSTERGATQSPNVKVNVCLPRVPCPVPRLPAETKRKGPDRPSEHSNTPSPVLLVT